jgi:transposase-like protein
MYLYRAVDSKGNMIDLYLSKTRDKKAVKRFFKKALRSFHVSKPRVMTVDKNPANETGCNRIILNKSAICGDFFLLKYENCRGNITKVYQLSRENNRCRRLFCIFK